MVAAISVRSLAARAREDLQGRADALLRYEHGRFDDLVDHAGPGPEDAAALRAAAAELTAARA